MSTNRPQDVSHGVAPMQVDRAPLRHEAWEFVRGGRNTHSGILARR